MIVLAEAINNNRAYFLKVIFNKNTKEIVRGLVIIMKPISGSKNI